MNAKQAAAEVVWAKAQETIPEHDAQFGGVLYELDGVEWRYDRETGLWCCRCRDCVDEPQAAEKLSYADLIAEYTVSDWPPSKAA